MRPPGSSATPWSRWGGDPDLRRGADLGAVVAEVVRFDPSRRERMAFTFGAGPHACPGEALATPIARIGVDAPLAAGARPERILEGLSL